MTERGQQLLFRTTCNARGADAVIHTAFNHDFSRFLENCAEDKRAIEAMGAVLEGSKRPMLVTSGLASLAPGRIATEADKPSRDFPPRFRGWRS